MERSLPPTVAELQARIGGLQEELNNALTLVTKYRAENETFKLNFESLRSAHSQQLEVEQGLKQQLNAAEDSLRLSEIRHEDSFRQWRHELDVRLREIDELKKRVITPHDIEVVRMQIKEELEIPHKQRLEQLERENEQYRTSAFKLRRDFELLRVESDHEKAEHLTIVNEIEQRRANEVRELIARIELLQQASASGDDAVEHKLRAALKEGVDLRAKLKATLAEVEDVRSQKEEAEVERERQARNHQRVVSDATVHRHTLEAQLESATLRIARADEEVNRMRRQRDEDLSRLDALEKELGRVQRDLDEASHAAEVEKSELRLQHAEKQGLWDRERTQLVREIHDARVRAEEAEKAMHEAVEEAAQRERDLARQAKSLRSEDFAKIQQLEASRAEYESRADAAESARADVESRMRGELERLSSALTAQTNKAQGASREIEELRQRLSDSEAHHMDLSAKVERMQRDLASAEQRLSAASASESEMRRSHKRMDAAVADARAELAHVRSVGEHERAQMRAALERAVRERDALRTSAERRDSELERKLGEETIKREAEVEAHKQTKSRCARKIRHLLDKLDILAAKNEKFDMEKQMIKKSSELEQINLNRRLREMQRKQDEFRVLLNADGSVASDPIAAPLPYLSLFEQERRTRNMIGQMDRHLDTMTETMREQVAGLTGVTGIF
eukprot:Opistho-2@53404